jgi:uncharacterized protein YhhL (DUF1145 family)
MNKYQIQALLDMGKVAIGIFAVIALVNGIIMLGMEANDIVTGISFVVMIYCLYQLFNIRVAQLKDKDTVNEITKKYE